MWVNEPWAADPSNYDSGPRELSKRLLGGCEYTRRRVANDVAKVGYPQVAAILGMKAAWLRALLREPTPKPKPKPWQEALGPLCWTVPVFKTVQRPAHWIPLDVSGI